MRSPFYSQSPTNPTGISRGIDSRYMDKPFQLIVFDNCVAGQMGEHSVMDGAQYFHLCDDLLAFLADPKSDFQLSPSPSVIAVPEPLDFDLTSISEIQQAISKAQLFVHDLASSKSLSFVRISYGKAAIKAFGVGPDGWAQMIVQVAYARLAERKTVQSNHGLCVQSSLLSPGRSTRDAQTGSGW